jgi:hypothetical protein
MRTGIWTGGVGSASAASTELRGRLRPTFSSIFSQVRQGNGGDQRGFGAFAESDNECLEHRKRSHFLSENEILFQYQ